MLMGFRHSKWKLALGVALLTAGLPFVSQVASQAQSPGDIIQIGNSPSQWNQFESYWNQLINLSGPATPAASQGSGAPTASATDPQVLEKELIRNLQVSKQRLVPIIGLSASSQLVGSITNRNKKPVTVSSINFEIIGPDGKMAQTATAVPDPSTIPAGATVTFQRQLLTVPSKGRSVRLSNPPFSIQGGI
jgi:hypothetical protein